MGYISVCRAWDWIPSLLFQNEVTGQPFPAWLWVGGNRLGSTGQALALAWARQTERGSAADDLRAWQAAPYIDAVLTQTRTCWLLRLAARLHRYQFSIANGHLQLDMVRKKGPGLGLGLGLCLVLELFFVILHQAANLDASCVRPLVHVSS